MDALKPNGRETKVKMMGETDMVTYINKKMGRDDGRYPAFNQKDKKEKKKKVERVNRKKGGKQLLVFCSDIRIDKRKHKNRLEIVSMAGKIRTSTNGE